MSINSYAGLMKRGNDVNKPAAAYWLIGLLYHAIDTGNLYYYADSTTRTLLQGPEKVEILKNKTFNFADNLVTGLIKDPFVSMKREGFLTPAPTAEGSLNLALKGLPFVGNYSLVRDTTEGYVSRFSASSVIQIGYQSNSSIQLTTRRAYNSRLKVRCRSSNADKTYMYLGFSTKLPTPNGEFPVDNNTPGVIIATTYTNANYFSRNSNGTNYNHTNSSIPRDSIFRTFEIIMSSSNIIIKINDNTVHTLTTNLPDLDTDLYLLIELHNGIDSNNFEIAKVYFRDDITEV